MRSGVCQKGLVLPKPCLDPTEKRLRQHWSSLRGAWEHQNILNCHKQCTYTIGWHLLYTYTELLLGGGEMILIALLLQSTRGTINICMVLIAHMDALGLRDIPDTNGRIPGATKPGRRKAKIIHPICKLSPQ